MPLLTAIGATHYAVSGGNGCFNYGARSTNSGGSPIATFPVCIAFPFFGYVSYVSVSTNTAPTNSMSFSLLNRDTTGSISNLTPLDSNTSSNIQTLNPTDFVVSPGDRIVLYPDGDLPGNSTISTIGMEATSFSRQAYCVMSSFGASDSFGTGNRIFSFGGGAASSSGGSTPTGVEIRPPVNSTLDSLAFTVNNISDVTVAPTDPISIGIYDNNTQLGGAGIPPGSFVSVNNGLNLQFNRNSRFNLRAASNASNIIVNVTCVFLVN
jgi:hypothetical protein